MKDTSQWISVQDSYPDIGKWVLISFTNSDGTYRFHPDVARWKGSYWDTESNCDLEFYWGVLVTHWMNIPEITERN